MIETEIGVCCRFAIVVATGIWATSLKIVPDFVGNNSNDSESIALAREAAAFAIGSIDEEVREAAVELLARLADDSSVMELARV
ncbi:MAG: hypothetical protein R3A47_02845 [Polyangiales bacterium]